MADEFDIDSAITGLEVKIAAMQDALASLRKARDTLAGVGIASGSRGGSQIVHDSFVGLSIVEASEQYLKLVGRPARSTDELVDALTRGGLQRVAPASVATLLIREHNGGGAIVRAQKGFWGLAQWYPKRPPKLKRTGTVPEGKTVEDVVEEGVAEGKTVEEMIDEAVGVATSKKDEERVPRTPVK